MASRDKHTAYSIHAGCSAWLAPVLRLAAAARIPQPELRQDVLHRVLPLPLGQHLELVPFNLCMHDPVISWLRGPMMVPVHERMKMSSPMPFSPRSSSSSSRKLRGTACRCAQRTINRRKSKEREARPALAGVRTDDGGGGAHRHFY